MDSGLLLTGEVEKWTLIPSHYKLLSSFVTVTIFQGETLLETAGDRQKHIYFSLPGHHEKAGRGRSWRGGGSLIFNTLGAGRDDGHVASNLCLQSDPSDIRQLDNLEPP